MWEHYVDIKRYLAYNLFVISHDRDILINKDIWPILLTIHLWSRTWICCPMFISNVPIHFLWAPEMLVVWRKKWSYETNETIVFYFSGLFRIYQAKLCLRVICFTCIFIFNTTKIFIEIWRISGRVNWPLHKQQLWHHIDK